MKEKAVASQEACSELRGVSPLWRPSVSVGAGYRVVYRRRSKSDPTKHTRGYRFHSPTRTVLGCTSRVRDYPRGPGEVFDNVVWLFENDRDGSCGIDLSDWMREMSETPVRMTVRWMDYRTGIAQE